MFSYICFDLPDRKEGIPVRSDGYDYDTCNGVTSQIGTETGRDRRQEERVEIRVSMAEKLVKMSIKGDCRRVLRKYY